MRDCASTFLDLLPGMHQEHDATERLVEYIQIHALSLTSTFTRLAQDIGVSDWLVRDIVLSHIEQFEHKYKVQTPSYLGIDEIYVEDAIYCVLTDLERHCLIDGLPKRDMETVKRWLSQVQEKNQIEAAIIDMWNPYRLAIRTILPKARIIASHPDTSTDKATETRSKDSPEARTKPDRIAAAYFGVLDRFSAYSA